MGRSYFKYNRGREARRGRQERKKEGRNIKF